jgi:hypothetical protein
MTLEILGQTQKYDRVNVTTQKYDRVNVTTQKYDS